MKSKLLVTTTFIFTLVGCISNPTPTEILPTEIQTPVVPLSPTQTLSEINNLPAFQIEYASPSNRVIDMSELNLDPSTRILAFDAKTQQILSISHRSTITILKSRSDSIVKFEKIEISPDHRWFAYLEINGGFNIWISSVDGTQHFMGIQNAVGSSFRWLSNDKLAVYNKLGLWMDCPSEMQIFDPFSKEVNDVPGISTQGSPSCFPIPYFNPDFSRALYLNLYNETGWKLYNYKAQTSYSVLPGLDTSPGGDKYFFHWEKDGLSFAMPDSDKISFVRNVPEGDLTSKPPIETISLPQNTINENKFFEFWIPGKQLAGFDLIGINKKSVLTCGVLKSFVIVNLITQELKNYCLDRSVFSDQVGTAWFTYVSADNRFAGWTVRELPSNDKPLGTVILDIETGKISYLQGYEFLGFGELSP